MVFGGFTNVSWTSDSGYITDPIAFVFSLTYKTKHIIKTNTKHLAVYHKSHLLTAFGGGLDIKIVDKCNKE